MARRLIRRCTIALAAVALAACSTAPPKRDSTAQAQSTSPSPAQPPPRSNGYYKNDGPGANPPANLDSIPDAIPRPEPLHRFANRPYTVFGRDYVPATSLRPYSERGTASWYGRMFHGEKTSIGDIYDMYAMTAAHPTLPLPSYARVTNVASGKSVVVRVNDRGPFHPGRVIDLSYAAAHRLGIAQPGSGLVDVEAILPSETIAAAALPPVASTPAELVPPIVPIATPSEATLSAPSATGFAVQLGAFASYANAQAFLAHVSPRLARGGSEPKVRQVSGLYRVFLGPYTTRDEARRNADSVRDALGLASTIAVH
jgi:rare lipoprotein A